MLKDLALQLYSVRDYTEKDFLGTLKTLAEQGYTGVEFAGYGDIPAKEMRKALDDLGLKAVGSHISLDRLRDNLEEELAYNAEVGNKYIICPWADVTSTEKAKEIAEFLCKVNERCQKDGFVAGYHNHAHEFVMENGKYALDVLRENTPDSFVFELDLYWVTYGGADASDYMKLYAGRLPLVHLKQIKRENGEKFNVVLGEGELDFAKLIPEAQALGATQFIVEQENYGTRTSLECAKLDVDHIFSL